MRAFLVPHHLAVARLDGEASGRHAARVMLNMSALPAAVATVWPGLVACLVGLALAVLGRRRPWVMAASGAVAAAAGWKLLLPWRSAVWHLAAWQPLLSPHGTLEHLILPALVIAVAGVAGVRLGSAWPGRAATAFGGWWLAGSAAALPEFWRVWFAAGVGAWVLRRLGAAAPGRAAAAALCMAGVAMLAGSPVWAGAGLVAAGAAVAMLAGGRDAALPPAVLMLLIMGTEIGLGQAVRGRVGLIETGCLAAVAAPWLTPRIERLTGRRLGPAGPVAAPVLTAALLAGAAWIAARAIHLH